MPEVVSNFIEVYVYLKNKNDFKFLLLKRSMNVYMPGIWQIITGKVHSKETAYNSALRETKEETGFVPNKFYIGPNVTSFYMYKNDTVNLVPTFLAEIENENIILSEEHTEYLWLNIEEAIEKIYWPNQKENLELIYKYLTNSFLFKKLVEIQINK